MKTIKTLLFLILFGSIAYQAHAYYQYRKAANVVPPRVKTVKARSGELRITLSGSGVLQAMQTSIIAVRQVQSRIVQITEDGQMVKTGQVVCQLDTTTITKELRERKEAYDTAVAAVAKAEAEALLNLSNAKTKAKKALQEQELLLTTNRAATDQANAQVTFNKGDLEYALRQKNRQESLARDRLVPQREAETALLNAQGKELSVLTAGKQLEVQEQTEKIGKSQGEMLIQDAKFGEETAKNKAEQQVANAKFNVGQARRMLEMSQFQLQWCTIKSPLTGLAVVQREYDESLGGARPLRAGDQVYPSRGLMEIIDTSRMVVQADVGEIDIGHVRVGQSARVFPRVAPGVSLRARVKSVSEIAQAPQVGRSNRLPGKKVFRVLLTILDSRPKLLRPGMSADFEVVEASLNQGVRVPLHAVFPITTKVKGSRSSGSDARSHGGSAAIQNPKSIIHNPKSGIVYVRRNGRFWPKTVTLGKRNDNDVLVLKGLKQGEVLAERQPPASLIGPPARRVRPVKGTAGLSSLLPWGIGK